MKNLPIDSNSRAIQCASLGYGSNYEAGVIPDEFHGLVRIKNFGDDVAVIRYANDSNSDGVYISSGETEYFYVNGILEVVSGSVNIMC